jgi:hypothetical protein
MAGFYPIQDMGVDFSHRAVCYKPQTGGHNPVANAEETRVVLKGSKYDTPEYHGRIAFAQLYAVKYKFRSPRLKCKQCNIAMSLKSKLIQLLYIKSNIYVFFSLCF